MTFDDTDRAGTAKLVPFRDPVETPEGLIEEAQELWKAEQPNAQQGMVGASWGCVGVSVPRELPLEWREAWSNYFREHTRKAIPPVGDDGRLDIPWPQDAEHLDVILATATKPKPPHVTAIDVAHAWIDQDEGHERYFFENVRHGIRTPDDHTIWQRIQERPPRWLGDSRYREAIDLLNRQP